MTFFSSLFSLNGLINTFLILCVSIGGFFAFRYGMKKQNFTAMEQTIIILQNQVNAIQTSLDAVEKRNVHLEYVIETVQVALKQKGIIISIDGDLITISDALGKTSSSIRKRAPAPVKKPTTKKFPPKKEADANA